MSGFNPLTQKGAPGAFLMPCLRTPTSYTILTGLMVSFPSPRVLGAAQKEYIRRWLEAAGCFILIQCQSENIREKQKNKQKHQMGEFQRLAVWGHLYRSKESHLSKHTKGITESQPSTDVNGGWLALQGVNAVQEPLSNKAREDPGLLFKSSILRRLL